MMIVAVTGGIGSGKSTVSALLVARGGLLVDSDLVAREVVAPGSDGLAAIAECFGASVISPDGSLNRPAMASIVFSDPTARALLNDITHPLIRRRFAEVVQSAPADALIINDIPLLNSVQGAAGFALVIGVGADAERRISRLIGRGLSETDARSRMGAQITDHERRLLADHWLDNDGTPEEIRAQVDDLWRSRLSVMNDNLLHQRPAAASGFPPAAPALTQARIRLAAAGAGVDVTDVTCSSRALTAVTVGDPGRDALTSSMHRAGFVRLSTVLFGSADPAQPWQVTFDLAR